MKRCMHVATACRIIRTFDDTFLRIYYLYHGKHSERLLAILDCHDYIDKIFNDSENITMKRNI